MARKRGRPKKETAPREEMQNLWPFPTVPHGHKYYFSAKHHGAGSATDARWHPDITRQEEFSIFQLAARLGLRDSQGNLYNVMRRADGGIRELGVCYEQLARFWKPVASERWQGHPLCPVVTESGTNRGMQINRPDKAVFDKLVERRMLSERDSHRLRCGKNI
jgi:hypothetical protein